MSIAHSIHLQSLERGGLNAGSARLAQPLALIHGGGLAPQPSVGAVFDTGESWPPPLSNMEDMPHCRGLLIGNAAILLAVTLALGGVEWLGMRWVGLLDPTVEQTQIETQTAATGGTNPQLRPLDVPPTAIDPLRRADFAPVVPRT